MTEYLEDTAIYQSHFLDEVPYPNLVMLETSSWCNLRCPKCPRTLGKSPSAGSSGQEFGHLRMELLDRLDGLFRQTRSAVLSWFGEPLLNKQITEIVRRLKTYGLSVHITTNGMLLTERLAAELVRAGLDHMAISMDAAEPETFRQLRAGADLDTVKSNILRLNRIKRELGSPTPHLQVAFVAMPENIRQLPAMIRLVDAMDIRQFTIGPLDDFALTHEYGIPSQAALGPRAQVQQAYREARDLARAAGITIGVESAARFYHELGESSPEYAIADRFFRNDYAPDQTTVLGFRKGCGVPWLHAMIGYNGDVHPCCVSGRVLGNVYEKSFDEIWWGKEYRAFRAQLKSTRPPPECCNCRRAHWTTSQSLEEMGDSMRVGQLEVHGQGWTPLLADAAGQSFRRIDRASTFFLRDRGQAFLSLELGTYLPMGTPGQVEANGAVLKRFRVQVGWQRYFFRLPQSERHNLLKIRVSSLAFSQVLIRNASLHPTDPRRWVDSFSGWWPMAYARGLGYVAKQVLFKRAPRVSRWLHLALNQVSRPMAPEPP